MDEFTSKHFESWFDSQMYRDVNADQVRAAMITEFESDPDFWAEHSYWDLYDHVRG